MKAIIAIVAFGIMAAVSAFAQTTTVEQPTTVAQSTPEAVLGAAPVSMSPSPELVAAKRAAAEMYLQRDLIKITLGIKDYGGIRVNLDFEAYPKRFKVKTFGSGSYCEVPELEAIFGISPQGDVTIEKKPRFSGCPRHYIVFNPITKEAHRFFRTEEGLVPDSVTVITLNN